jgi:hippurate hydrolase
MLDALKSDADDVYAEIVEVRRTLHRRPELSGAEHETARRVAERLRALDLDVRTGVYGTGVVGTPSTRPRFWARP